MIDVACLFVSADLILQTKINELILVFTPTSLSLSICRR